MSEGADPHFKDRKVDNQFRTNGVIELESILASKRHQINGELRQKLELSFKETGREGHPPIKANDKEGLREAGHSIGNLLMVATRLINTDTIELKVRHVKAQNSHIPTLHVRGILIDASADESIVTGSPMKVMGEWPGRNSKDLLIDFNKQYAQSVVTFGADPLAQGVEEKLKGSFGRTEHKVVIPVNVETVYGCIVTYTFDRTAVLDYKSDFPENRR